MSAACTCTCVCPGCEWSPACVHTHTLHAGDITRRLMFVVCQNSSERQCCFAGGRTGRKDAGKSLFCWHATVAGGFINTIQCLYKSRSINAIQCLHKTGTYMKEWVGMNAFQYLYEP
eukprot:scaffold105237_cov20-Tisochrysis_lutea.AAC.1